MGVSGKERKQIVKCLFGPEGVMSSDEELIFGYRLEKARELWASLASNDKQVSYFERVLEPKLRTNFRTKIKMPWVADLGNWTNNNSESMNSVLKQMVEWKSQDLTTLVGLIKKVCKVNKI